jgi:hypothetical protein
MFSCSESTSNSSSPKTSSKIETSNDVNFKTRTYSNPKPHFNQSNVSPIFEYFQSSQICLKKQYSQNIHNFKSNNYLPKDISQYETDKDSNDSTNLQTNDLNENKPFYFLPQPLLPMFTNYNIMNTTPMNNCNNNNKMNNYYNFNNYYYHHQGITNTNTNLNSDEYITEMFGRRGWICNLCSNFNYETRKKCNKCNEIKNPRKIIHNNNNNNNMMNNNLKTNETHNNTYSIHDNNNTSSKDNLFVSGDWICCKCNNLNYSFRVVCNRCNVPK